jgi:hypothetical protein
VASQQQEAHRLSTPVANLLAESARLISSIEFGLEGLPDTPDGAAGHAGAAAGASRQVADAVDDDALIMWSTSPKGGAAALRQEQLGMQAHGQARLPLLDLSPLQQPRQHHYSTSDSSGQQTSTEPGVASQTITAQADTQAARRSQSSLSQVNKHQVCCQCCFIGAVQLASNIF